MGFLKTLMALKKVVSTYCKLLYFRQYQFSSNGEKRRFRQYVNSSFEDYQNYIDCHDTVTLIKELLFAQLINRRDSLFGLSIIIHYYKQ